MYCSFPNKSMHNKLLEKCGLICDSLVLTMTVNCCLRLQNYSIIFAEWVLRQIRIGNSVLLSLKLKGQDSVGFFIVTFLFINVCRDSGCLKVYNYKTMHVFVLINERIKISSVLKTIVSENWNKEHRTPPRS